MLILDIYQKYFIPENLQRHQLRVAGVAQIITENFVKEIDTESIIKACLLHDMGNLIKFDLDSEFSVQLYQGQVIKDLKKRQKKMINDYGNDEHQATLEIAQEIGVSDRVLELIDAIGFENTEQNVNSDDWNKKICEYADMRIAPSGVVTLNDRLEDLKNRYSHRYQGKEHQRRREHFFTLSRKNEADLSKNMVLSPWEITESQVHGKMNDLKQVEI